MTPEPQLPCDEALNQERPKDTPAASRLFVHVVLKSSTFALALGPCCAHLTFACVEFGQMIYGLVLSP